MVEVDFKWKDIPCKVSVSDEWINSILPEYPRIAIKVLIEEVLTAVRKAERKADDNETV